MPTNNKSTEITVYGVIARERHKTQPIEWADKSGRTHKVKPLTNKSTGDTINACFADDLLNDLINDLFYQRYVTERSFQSYHELVMHAPLLARIRFLLFRRFERKWFLTKRARLKHEGKDLQWQKPGDRVSSQAKQRKR